MASASPGRSFPPEVELILRAASVAPPEARGEAIGRLLATPLDWTLVLAMARRHGVLPLLHAGLDGDAVVPDDVRRRLTSHFETNAARNRRLHDDLVLLVALMGRAGVDVVPFRAAALPSPLAELVDLDLLVYRHDVAAATAILTRLGFVPEVQLSAREAAALLRTGGSRRFVQPGRRIVSLHWAIGAVAERLGPPLDDLLVMRAARPPGTDVVPTLTPAAMLQVLCLCGTVNRWERLTWVRDVALVLRHSTPDEQHGALVQARSSGSARALGVGVALATRLLDAPAEGIDAAARRDPTVLRLAALSVAEMAAATPARPGRAAIMRFHLAVRERWHARLAYCIRWLLTPTRADVEAIPLPPRLHLLLPALRPLRLVASGLGRRRQHLGHERLARFGATPTHVIDAMLALADVTPDDTLLDVGCGDGRIVTRAAKQIGCRALGIEIDPGLAAAARRRAVAAGVDHLVDIACADVRAADISRATVATLYLNAAANLVVRPVLERQLGRGARVVSRNFTMGSWLPDASEILEEAPWGCDTLYLWRVGEALRPAPGADEPERHRAERPTA